MDNSAPVIPLYNEKELLLQVAEGNEFAFGTLHERHWPKLYNFLLQMVKSPEVAEEIVFDIFLKLWTGREWIQKIDNVEAFLCVVARNKALNFLKLTARDRQLQKIYFKEMHSQSSPSADHLLLDAETRTILDAAVRQLAPQRRKVFLLSREEGLSYEEIAAQLNISPHTVKRTMSNALDSIRTFLKKNHSGSLPAMFLFVNL